MNIEELLKKQGKIAYTIKGISMMPLLRQDKDIVIIEDSRNKDYSDYDVVLYKRENANKKDYVLHRIQKDNHDGTYCIMGDNTLTEETVKRENIIGILESIKRGKRTIKKEDRFYKAYVNKIGRAHV